MTVTIDPSDMRPSTAKPRERARFAVRQALLAGIGLFALAGFTAGAFSFFSGLADPRARTARPVSVASAWPDLKDGVPALASQPAGASAAAPVLNLPRPDQAEPRRNADAGDFQLRDAPPAQAEGPTPAPAALPPAVEAKAERAPTAPSDLAAVPDEAAAGPSPLLKAGEVAAGEDSARRSAKLAPAASARAMPAIENAEPVTGEIKAAAILTPARTASAIAPSRAETIRAKSAEPGAFMSLPPEPAPSEPTAHRADPVKTAATTKSAAAKPAPVKPKPVQAAPAKPPAQKPVMQASAAPAPAQAAPAREAEDPEVMGVKIPGGRHVRDGWQAVFGGAQQN